MPVIVDATIQGKLNHPIMSNVLTNSDRMDLAKQTAGNTEVTQKNADKISREKGVYPIPAQLTGAADGANLGRQMAKQVTVPLSEQFKGQNVNVVA